MLISSPSLSRKVETQAAAHRPRKNRRDRKVSAVFDWASHNSNRSEIRSPRARHVFNADVLLVRQHVAGENGQKSESQERKSMASIVEPWRVGKRRSSMDILASIFAYLVCVTGLVTGLVMSFVVVFSAPNPQSPLPRHASAMVAKLSVAGTKASPVQTIAEQKTAYAKQKNAYIASTGAAAKTVPPKTARPVTIAADARQRPLPQAQLRRWAERERAKHLASRERSSFETRFLHYDD